MKDTLKGWVIVSSNHPVAGIEFIVASTFKRLRRDAIKEFCQGSGSEWNYWRKKFNFKAVKAEQSITLIQ